MKVVILIHYVIKFHELRSVVGAKNDREKSIPDIPPQCPLLKDGCSKTTGTRVERIERVADGVQRVYMDSCYSRSIPQ